MRTWTIEGHDLLCDGQAVYEINSWVPSGELVAEDLAIAQFIVDACNEKEIREADPVLLCELCGYYHNRAAGHMGDYAAEQRLRDLAEPSANISFTLGLTTAGDCT